MTRQFLERGFEGVCSDISESTCAVLRENLSSYGSQIQVIEGLDRVPAHAFDYLFAFEVLEHIPKDLAALRTWTTFLRTGGRALISVPAHQQKFGRTDVARGHVRRYERDQLHELLSAAGFVSVILINYGFPLGNLTRRIQSLVDWVIRPEKRLRHLSPKERSILSGIQSTRATRSTSWLVNERTLSPFVRLQRRFFSGDLGDGYIATGVLARADET